ncbi:hypothetical protein MAPG_09945 [Magnaporthiopsis poae ATCC 64411]|uniref:Uncharacterized protein n=1 Tax=Magnaporthiopsis poae (strain ATCC 64411 / 73-15) TaxID=644358 RepID=A0A0C4EB98_MAGP6|nr:hypothetical protein MAPG_09945 [Magnaporthiopsis poae ATCC 64411]
MQKDWANPTTRKSHLRAHTHHTHIHTYWSTGMYVRAPSPWVRNGLRQDPPATHQICLGERTLESQMCLASVYVHTLMRLGRMSGGMLACYLFSAPSPGNSLC